MIMNEYKKCLVAFTLFMLGHDMNLCRIPSSSTLMVNISMTTPSAPAHPSSMVK